MAKKSTTTRAIDIGISEKDRAELAMITDLVRNDLGRVADYGSVSVPELFQVERYPTVWQMTSTVQARSRAAFCCTARLWRS